MKLNLKKPEILFVILAFIFGLALIFLQPLGSGNDEETHMARIFEMSLGPQFLIPNSYFNGNGIPSSFRQISYRQRSFLEPVTWEQIKKSIEYPIISKDYITYQTRATYSPLNYLGQAILMGVVIRINNAFSLGLMYYALRLSYLLLYIILVYFGIRLIPSGKWVVFVLALAPMPMLQASWISADSVSNGLTFFLVAWVLHFANKTTKLNWGNLLVMLLLVCMVSSVKLNNLPIILMLFLIKPNQYPKKWVYYAFWVVSLSLLVFLVLKWNMIAWNSDAVRRGVEGTSPINLIAEVLSKPFQFLFDLFSYVNHSIANVIPGWIAMLGYGYWAIPPVIFYIFPLTLLCAILADFNSPFMKPQHRLALLLVFSILFFGTFALRMILGDAMEKQVSTHGRYITSIMPLLFLALVGWKPVFKYSTFFTPAVISFSALIMTILLTGMYMSYYQTCGSSSFTGKACIYPVYKNWDPNKSTSRELLTNDVYTQTIKSICKVIDQVNLRVFNTKPENFTGTIKVKIISDKTGDIIGEQAFNPQDIPENGTIHVDVVYPANAIDQRFTIQVTNQSTHEKVFLGYTSSDDYPFDLLLNNKNISGDLLFTYRCQP
jgi:uncharacterized membrane protein